MYCIKCGTKLTARTIEARPRDVCPKCGWIAYLQLKVGAGVLAQRDGKLLLVQRGLHNRAFPGAWNLPAGYCEADEPPDVTAARETAEETGLQVDVGSLAGSYFFDDDPRGNGLLLVFEAKIISGQLRTDGSASPIPGEVHDAGFFPPDQLPQPLCGGGHDRAIAAWQARALNRWTPGDPMRYCPHCTHPLEEAQAFGQCRPTCPACGFVHFRELKVGVSVLAAQDGRVLMVRRAIEPGLGLWSLPSGFVEWDETPEMAAARECEEETGLIIADLDLLAANHYEDYRGPGINLTYLAKVAGGRLQAGDDARDAQFFTREELPPGELIAFAGHRDLLARWQAAVY